MTKQSDEIVPMYLRPSKAAKLIDVGRSKIYELIRRGEIRAVEIGGLLRVPVSELEALRDRVVGGVGTIGGNGNEHSEAR